MSESCFPFVGGATASGDLQAQLQQQQRQQQQQQQQQQPVHLFTPDASEAQQPGLWIPAGPDIDMLLLELSANEPRRESSDAAFIKEDTVAHREVFDPSPVARPATLPSTRGNTTHVHGSFTAHSTGPPSEPLLGTSGMLPAGTGGGRGREEAHWRHRAPGSAPPPWKEGAASPHPVTVVPAPPGEPVLTGTPASSRPAGQKQGSSCRGAAVFTGLGEGLLRREGLGSGRAYAVERSMALEGKSGGEGRLKDSFRMPASTKLLRVPSVVAMPPPGVLPGLGDHQPRPQAKPQSTAGRSGGMVEGLLTVLPLAPPPPATIAAAAAAVGTGGRATARLAATVTPTAGAEEKETAASAAAAAVKPVDLMMSPPQFDGTFLDCLKAFAKRFLRPEQIRYR